MIGTIDVTGIDLARLVREAYNPSRPLGLGHLHFEPGDLTDEEVQAIIDRTAGRTVAVRMDYVKGRSVKMTVSKAIDGRLYIQNRWYDHSDADLRALLVAIDLSPHLVDKARAEQEAHETKCADTAVAFLRANGGAYVETRTETNPDPLVANGFYVGQARNVIKADYLGEGGTRWSLVAPLSDNQRPEEQQ